MGTITGVAGGVLRDVLLGEIPLVFRPGRLYATAAIVGAGIYVLLAGRGVSKETAAVAGMVAIAGLRLAAIFWRLELPVVPLPERRDQLRGRAHGVPDSYRIDPGSWRSVPSWPRHASRLGGPAPPPCHAARCGADCRLIDREPRRTAAAKSLVARAARERFGVGGRQGVASG